MYVNICNENLRIFDPELKLRKEENCFIIL